MSRSFLYDMFAIEYSYLVEKVESWEEVNQFELKLKFKTGETVLYEDVYRTCRILPEDPNLMTEEEIKREFGVRLRNMLRQRGMTQDDLAMMSGLSQTQISGYITGRHTPSFSAVDKIAKALECSADEFRYL